MTTIDLQGRYVVHAGDSVGFLNEDGFRLSGEGAELINAGMISLAHGASDAAVIAIDVAGDGATFWNRQGGALKVHTGTSTQDTAPIAISAAHALIRNDGLISVSGSAGAYGMIGGGSGVRIENNGLLQVHAGDGARGIMVGTSCQVHNTGVIHASADSAAAVQTLQFESIAGGFDNEGVVRADGGTAAVALALWDAQEGYQLTNAGRILATVTDAASTSVGVGLPSVLHGQIGVDNSGLIRADLAIQAYVTSESEVRITNSGRILGDIDISSPSSSGPFPEESLANTGLIRGEVRFGDGGDLYDGSHGRLIGELYGEGGADTLIGGAHAEELWGDGAQAGFYDRSDLLKGGGGADTLHGGAGADVFAFDHLSDSAWSAPDLIADLDASDVIDLSAIDADATQGGDQAFQLVAALDGHAGQAALSYDAASELTRLELDADGDGHADAVIAMSGDHAGFTGFVL